MLATPAAHLGSILVAQETFQFAVIASGILRDLGRLEVAAIQSSGKAVVDRDDERGRNNGRRVDGPRRRR